MIYLFKFKGGGNTMTTLKKQINLRLDDTLLKHVDRLTEEKKLSRNEVITRALKIYLAKEEKA